MALFLFLVCAALAAVILAASTAAAGRVAGLAEADQKYYSVSSAAELMRDMMGGNDGVSAQIECTKTTTFKRSGGVMTQQGNPNYNYTIKSDGDTASFFAKLAEQLVLAEAGSNAEDVWNWQLGVPSSGSSSSNFGLTYDYTITGGQADKAKTVLQQVNVDASLKSNGNIVLTFSAEKSGGSGGQAATPSKSAYVMELTCEAQGETKAATKTQTSGTTVTRIETKTTTLTWKASKLKSPTSLGA